MAAFGVAAAGCSSSVESTQSGSTAPADAGAGDSQSTGAPGDVPAGKVSGLSVGTLQAVGGAPVVIGRDSGGVYAMTLVCTHAGCAAGVLGAEIFCPCHDSAFDANGNVVHGPASAPLVHFAVSADGGGNLTIHTDTLVDPTTRLMV
jgi:Rieske Fe-S protein